MASPAEVSNPFGTTQTAGTTHTLNFSPNPNAGELIIVLWRFAGAPGTITFTGYTSLNGAAGDTSDASDDSTIVFYRWADGTEGASDTLSTVNSVKACAVASVISGAIDPATQAPEISTVAVGTTTANTANPGSRAVTGGPKDVLYLAMMAQDGELNTPTVAPTNYGNLQVQSSGTAGAVATNCTMGLASRQVSASSSDDPGVFTHAAAANGWTAYTVVVHPPGASATSAPFPNDFPRLVRKLRSY